MTFTVIYREKSGARAERIIDAANRAGCVAECRRCGIAPMSIREGVSRKNNGHENGSPRGCGRARGAAIIVIAVLVLAGGAWWWLGRKGSSTPPQIKAPVVDKTKPVINRPVQRASKPQEVPVTTNMPMVAVTNKPLTRRERMIAKYGKEPVVIKPGGRYKNGERLPEKRSIFKFASEKEIDRIISAKPGHRIIGRFAKGFIERDFRKALETKIEFTDEDTAEDIARKKQMIAVKEQLRQALDKGESLDAILEDARKEVNALADFRDNMIKNLSQLKKNGSTEQEIEDYYTAANKMLAEKNIPPLLSPFQIREKILALQRERGIEKQDNPQ